MTQLRIALVHPYSWPEVRRGGERYLADLTWYLRGAGHRVDVITGTNEAASAERTGDSIIRRVRNPARPRLERRGFTREDGFAVAALLPLLRARYDVVHALTPAAALAAIMAGHRTIYTVLGHLAPELVADHPVAQQRLFRAAVRRAHVVAALSRAAADAVEASFGRRAVVLSPGVRFDSFPLELKPRGNRPGILFPAFTSNPHKGLETLLRAFTAVRRHLPEARLVLAGPGDPSWAFARVGGDGAAVPVGVEVRGVGALGNVPLLYREAAVTVLPSLYEAFGLVLVESLASGTPVVCSRTAGGMAEIVDRPDIGRAVPFADVDALAGALHEVILLARDPLTPRRCREHASRWSWERIGPQHEALYRGVARGPRRALRSAARSETVAP